MRLEKKREEELARRRGMAIKTIIQFIWLLISFVIAYFLVDYLIDAEVLNLYTFYQIGIPTSVPQWALQGALMLIVVIFMQFFLFIGFAFANPEGRRRTGDPTLRSKYENPYEHE